MQTTADLIIRAEASIIINQRIILDSLLGTTTGKQRSEIKKAIKSRWKNYSNGTQTVVFAVPA